MVGSFQSFHVIWTVFISSHVTGHKFLEDVHEDSMQFPCQNNRFLCNCLDRPLKASGRPSVSRSFSFVAVWTLGQATPSLTWSWISVDTIWEVSAIRPNDVVTYLDATQCFRIIWVSFTDAERSDNENRPDARSSRLNMVLFWEELLYSRKAVTEDCLDDGKFSSGCSTARVRICLELGFLNPINRWL